MGTPEPANAKVAKTTARDQKTLDLETQVAQLQVSTDEQSYRIEELLAANAALEELLKDSRLRETVPSGDCVILAGKTYPIEAIDSAKDMMESIKRRFVRFEQTIIAIDRDGGR